MAFNQWNTFNQWEGSAAEVSGSVLMPSTTASGALSVSSSADISGIVTMPSTLASGSMSVSIVGSPGISGSIEMPSMAASGSLFTQSNDITLSVDTLVYLD